ncbi:hypothetical protein AAV32_04920 [Kerstersia gyiorum]|uniref:Uncharacterized protein n=2 Tax=Kerstersia gyiorum TaxID=206506 RepID=A0A171KU50_9BURK|nr:hypothetical protein AAV32_04920 [Kerstersia gyiorum]
MENIMADQDALESRLLELEERVRGMQIGLQNLVVAICANGSIDVSKVATSYNRLNDTIRERVATEDGPCRNATDHIGKVLEAAGSVIEQGLQEAREAGNKAH